MFSSTNRKCKIGQLEKMFNVRKVNVKGTVYNTGQPEKKILHTNNFQENQNVPNTCIHHSNKLTQFSLQQAILSSPQYIQLFHRYNQFKQKNYQKKNYMDQRIKQKQSTLENLRKQKERLNKEKEKYNKKITELREKLQEIRQQRIQQQQYRRSHQISISNFQYLRNIYLSLQYQNQLIPAQFFEDIDPDNMTYQVFFYQKQLLQLEQRIGDVSRGLNDQQLKMLTVQICKKEEYIDPCAICYSQLEDQNQIIKLICKHVFHSDCIRAWLVKQKKCPLCKSETLK